MRKRRIFCDFNNCIINSFQSFCRAYNYFYQDKPNFKLADWTKVEEYNIRTDGFATNFLF